MSSERYEPIDYDLVTSVQFLSGSSTSSSGDSSSTDPEREAAHDAHPTEFRKFAILYDALIEAVENKDRDQLFKVLGTPNPYTSGSESARPHFTSEFREELPEIFFENLESPKAPKYNFEGLFKGVSWAGNYKYNSASQFALRVAWMMYIPSSSENVRKYFDGRAEAHLRDLDAEYAPSAAGTQGNRLERNVRDVVDRCGLPLGPRNFRIETTEGVERRELDINTEVSGTPTILEVYTRPSSYVNKDDQVRDYARLFELTEFGDGETPHICEVTDTKRSRVHFELIEALLSAETEEVPTVPIGGLDPEDDTFELDTSADQHGELPEEVISHETAVCDLIETHGLDWSTPQLSMTISREKPVKYHPEKTRTTIEKRHIQLGPTVEVGPSWDSLQVVFLSEYRPKEQLISGMYSGVNLTSGSKLYPVIVPDAEYVRGESISVFDPDVLYALLQMDREKEFAPF